MNVCRLLSLLIVVVSLNIRAADAPKPEAKTGDYSITFTERSPVSSQPEISRRTVVIKGPDYNLADEGYEVSVPASYKPGAPYGLLVFINSEDNANIPGEFKPLLEPMRLIYVAGKKCGNSQSVVKRIGMAVDAVFNMKKIYNIDPQRVYLAGISGGGRASSHGATAYPDVFNGALYLCGCNPNTSKPPADWPERMKALNGFAFMTGDKDMNLQDTKGVLAGYVKQKFQRTSLFQVPEMGHQIPPTDWMKKGIVFLDQPLVAEAQALSKTAKDLQKREKFGAALSAYYKVAAHLGEDPAGKDASEQITVIEKKRDELLTQAQGLIDGGKKQDSINLLSKMIRDWEDQAGSAKELLKKAQK